MAQTKVQLLQPDLGDVIDFDSSTLFMDGSDNRVGIRNTNPQYELDVTGTVKATNFIGSGSTTIADWIIHDGDTNTKFGFPAADTFEIHAGGGPRLHINSTGQIITGGGTAISFNNQGNNSFGSWFEINGSHTVNHCGVLGITGNTVTNNTKVGRIQFLNTDNTHNSSAGQNTSRSLASIDVYADVANNNSAEDSGGRLVISTKAKAGTNNELLFLTADKRVGINVIPTGGDLNTGSTIGHPNFMVDCDHQGNGAYHSARFRCGGDNDWNAAVVSINHSNDRGLAIYGGRSTSNRSWGALQSIDNQGRMTKAIEIIGDEGQGVQDLKFYTGDATTTTLRLHIDASGRTSLGRNLAGYLASAMSSAANDFIVTAAAGSNGGMSIVNNGTNDIGNIFFAHGSGENAIGRIQYEHQNNALSFTANNGERLRIENTGEVWVKSGTLKLGTTSGTDNIIHTTNAAGILYRADENGHRFQTYVSGWQDRLIIKDDGKVGVGQSPNTKFNVSLSSQQADGTDDASDWGAGGIFQLDASNSGTGNEILLLGAYSGGVGQIASGFGFGRENSSNWGTYISLKTHSTSTSNIDELIERVRLDSTGHLHIKGQDHEIRWYRDDGTRYGAITYDGGNFNIRNPVNDHTRVCKQDGTEIIKFRNDKKVVIDNTDGTFTIGGDNTYNSSKINLQVGSMSQTSATTESTAIVIHDQNSKRNGTESAGSWVSGIRFMSTQINGGSRYGAFINQDITYNNFSGGATKMRSDLVFGTRGDAQTSSSDNPTEKLRITHSGTIQSIYGIQSGGNATGGFKLNSQYSGKGFDIATQYATASNSGSSGGDPMFSGWWGATNTFRVNTNGQIKFGENLVGGLRSGGFSIPHSNASGNTKTVTIAGLVSGAGYFSFGTYSSAGQGMAGICVCISGYQTATSCYQIQELQKWHTNNMTITSFTKWNTYASFTITNTHGSFTAGAHWHLWGNDELYVQVA